MKKIFKKSPPSRGFFCADFSFVKKTLVRPAQKYYTWTLSTLQAKCEYFSHIIAMTIWETITKNLSELIKQSTKMKSEIAKEVGIHHTTISHYLAGKAFPNYETLRKLCKVLDCTYEDILGKLE